MNLAEARTIAAVIDARVQQLRAQGASDQELLQLMVPFLPNFGNLWSSRSDATLQTLFREFHEFAFYAELMESGYDAWQSAGGPATLGPRQPSAAQERIKALKTEAEALACDLQGAAASSSGKSSWGDSEAMAVRARALREGVVALDGEMRSLGVSEPARATVAQAFAPLIKRVGELQDAACRRGR